MLVAIQQKIALPTEMKLAWQRALLDHAYSQDIATSRTAKDNDKIQSLESERHFEIDLHDEEEDACVTKQLLKKARRLRIPVPHRYNEDRSESEHWYAGRYTGDGYLTNRGIASIRREQWVVWVPALTGLVGTVTWLVALLGNKAQ